MSRNKAELWKRDRYARLVAVWRSVEAIRCDAFDVPGPRAVHVESSQDPHWDDLVEVFVDAPDDTLALRGWQIKRQTSAFDKATIEGPIRALHESTRLQRGCFGVLEDVDVKGVGRMRALKSLCERAVQPGADLAALVAILRGQERRWWRFLQHVIKGPDTSVFTLLQRLEVEFLGDEARLEFQASVYLKLLFESPTQDVLNALDVFFATIGDVSIVDVHLLEVLVLHRFAAKRRPTPSTLRTARATYLAHVQQSIDSRRVLNGVELDVSLQDVWVPVPQLSGPHDGSVPRPLRAWIDVAASTGCALIVFGDVGTGKTELLHRTAAELAASAEAVAATPIPVVVDARALISHGFDQAVRSRWPDVASELDRLLGAGTTRWIVIIDGLDEAEGNGNSAVLLVRSRLAEARLYAVVGATRPSMRSGIQGALEIWLAPWTPDELDRFLDRWERHDAGAVAALRKALPAGTRATLCDSPLVATLCLVAARQDPSTLRSRAGVYEVVVEMLFEGWARDRARRTGTSVTWREVAPVLRRIALEVARRERLSIPAEELRRLLRREARDDVKTVRDNLSMHFGVLVHRGDDAYDFAFRGLAEFLAGQQLLEYGDDAVVRAAFERWADETARHAIGCAALEDSDRAVALLGALLERERDDDIVRSNTNLRPLLVAVRAAADLGTITRPVAQRLADACARRLRDETSVWVGERVAAAVLDLARAGGPCWVALFEQCLDTACHPCRQPALWYEAQSSQEPSYWRALLFMSDREVRCLAIKRLTLWVDHPAVRTDLEWELFDDGSEHGAALPAVAAGWALRQARRDDAFAGTLTRLVERMNMNKPLLALASAVAIRHPDDGVDPALLVAALREARTDYSYPREVLEDLAGGDTGLRALDEGWPGWRDVPRWPEPTSVKQEYRDVDLSQSEPPSQYVRRRLSRILTAGVHHVDGERRARLLQGRADGDALFTLAPDCPDLICTLLDRPATSMFPELSPDTMDALGRAAVTYPSLRAQLVRRWDEISTVEGPSQWQEALRATLMRNYPGPALERLIERGDADAIRIYGAWFGLFRWPLGLRSRSPLSPAVLATVRVRDEARWHVDEVLAFASEDRIDNEGQRTRLSAGAAGSLLHQLSPLWRDDPTVHARLEAWIRDGDRGQFLGALVAFDGLAVSERVHDLVADRVRQQLRSVDEVVAVHMLHYFTLPAVLAFVHRSGMAGKIESELREIVSAGAASACHAAAVLLPLLDEHEANRISQTAAESPWQHSRLDLFDEVIRLRLVEAAPDAWADALEKTIRTSPIPPTVVLLPFFMALPRHLKRRVASTWVSAASPIELPWCYEGYRRDSLSRPADRIRQILFDMGIEGELHARDDP